MTDLRQTNEYAQYMQAIGWKVEINNGFLSYYKKIPILGNFIKIQRPENISYREIERLIRKIKPFQVIIEPKDLKQENLIKNKGFKQSKSYFVPSKTIQINLQKTEKQLLSEMHYKTRYNIGKAEKSKLRVKVENNIDNFADFWQRSALLQRGMYLSQKEEIVSIHKSFGNATQVIGVYDKEKLLSAILLICTKDTSYYMYAASTNEGKKLFAPTLNAWAAIKLAKKLNKKVFDFEGIYDERFPIKSWLGFSRFKKSFGGKEIVYPGTYQKFLLPFLI